jgi:DNA-binding GntR family transcriptional regulator
MKELFQIRVGLETLAAQLASQALLDPQTRARFEREIESIWEETPRLAGPDYIAENHRFHDAITQATGNEQLLRLTRQLRLTVLMYQLASTLKPENIAASVAEQRLIARAMLNGDGATAQQHVRAHLARALDVAEGMPNGSFALSQQD